MNLALDKSFNRAVSLQNANKLDGARALYSQILKIQPEHLPTLMNLGAICFTLQEYKLALNLYSIILKIESSSADALFNRGCTHQVLGEPEQAEQDYRACLELDPHKTICLENLIAVLSGREKSIDECIALVEKRLEISRDLNFLLVLAQYKAEAGKKEEAGQLYREVLALSPANSVANYFVATQQLSQGQIAKGIAGLHHRWSIPGFLDTNPPKVIPLRKWQHESLTGKRLFICAEQGVGDGVMFSCSITEMQQEADLLVMESDPRMMDIYQRSFPNVQIIPAIKSVLDSSDINWRELDYYSSFADLRGTYSQSATRSGGWLIPDPQQADQWASWLRNFSGIKIGISWRGGFGSKEFDKHSLELSEFMLMFQDHPVTLISLQYDPDLDEIEGINASSATPVLLPPDLDCRNDLNSLFALIHNLDLIITIDNCTAYFAASLGKPVWTLLPFNNDWRWDQGPEKSPWLRNIRQFRNPKIAGWDDLLAEVNSSLERFHPAGSAPSAMELYPADLETPRNIEQRVYNKKLLVINDTINWHHWGYSCASLSLHENLQKKGYRISSYPASAIRQISAFPLALNQFNDSGLLDRFSACCRELMDAIQAVDLVVINGEGSAGTASTIVLLYLAHIAKHAFNKNVQLLNHSFPFDGALMAAEQLTLYQNIYSALDYVVSDDAAGLKLCQKMGVSGSLGFSCLPLAIRDFFGDITREAKGNTILLGASDGNITESVASITRLISDAELQQDFTFEFLLGARANISEEDVSLVQVLNAHSPGGFSVRCCTSEAEWLSRIAQSRLVVSDRLHHSIAAACLNTPFVLYTGHLQPRPLSQLSIPGTDDLLSRCKASLLAPDEPGTSDEQINDLQVLAGKNFQAL